MKSIPKIIIKPRTTAQLDSDVDGDDVQAPEYDIDEPVFDEPVVKRGRGRPPGPGKAQTASGTSTPRPRGRPRGTGRGRGRPPKSGITIRLPKRPDDDEGEAEDSESQEAPSPREQAPPEAPLGGGKPFRRIQDKIYIIDGDEFVTEADPKGDQKVDQWGNLLEGRRFKASTFILPNRHPKRQYMLAIDAARTSGFRDSLYYFRRNPLAFKLNVTQPEKDFLIGEGKLGPHLRTRTVTLITARSAYKLHGSKMIVDGKWVVDDYYEDRALEEATEKGLKPGDPVGDLPDPNPPAQANDSAANQRNERSNAGTGGLGIYRAGGPTTIFGGSGWGPYSDGPLNTGRKSLLTRDGLTEENWMAMMSQKVLESNAEWSRRRVEALHPNGGAIHESLSATELAQVHSTIHHIVYPGEPHDLKRKLRDPVPYGLYEPHTGNVNYRADTQPTTSRMEPIVNSSKPRVLGGTKVGNAGWGLAFIDTVMEVRPHRTPDAERNRFVASVMQDSTV